MTNQNNDKSKNGKRIALILVALLLIAAIAFGAYTYSKYVENAKGAGSANVAQWGFTVSMENGENAGFSTKYNASGTADQSGTAIVADTSTDGNVVAPGANGQISFTVGGKAEVLAKITTSITNTSEISLTLTKDDVDVVYYPIKYTLNNGTSDIVDDGTMADVVTAITSDSTLNQTSIAAGTTITEKTYTLSWEWAFEGATFEVDDTNQYTVDGNELDTILGHIAANSLDPDTYTVIDSNKGEWTVTASEAETELSFSIAIGIEQIQSAS